MAANHLVFYFHSPVILHSHNNLAHLVPGIGNLYIWTRVVAPRTPPIHHRNHYTHRSITFLRHPTRHSNTPSLSYSSTSRHSELEVMGTFTGLSGIVLRYLWFQGLLVRSPASWTGDNAPASGMLLLLLLPLWLFFITTIPFSFFLFCSLFVCRRVLV